MADISLPRLTPQKYIELWREHNIDLDAIELKDVVHQSKLTDSWHHGPGDFGTLAGITSWCETCVSIHSLSVLGQDPAAEANLEALGSLSLMTAYMRQSRPLGSTMIEVINGFGLGFKLLDVDLLIPSVFCWRQQVADELETYRQIWLTQAHAERWYALDTMLDHLHISVDHTHTAPTSSLVRLKSLGQIHMYGYHVHAFETLYPPDQLFLVGSTEFLRLQALGAIESYVDTGDADPETCQEALELGKLTEYHHPAEALRAATQL